MKLLVLCGFLFVCLLCFNIFAAEGQKVRKRCCSKVLKIKKNPDKDVSFKMTPMEKKKYCKPCPRQFHPVIPGPLPQLK